MSKEIEKFCQIIRNRSEENDTAVKLLLENNLYGKVVEALRTELDSFVRIVYLMHQDQTHRLKLINKFLKGKKWNNITDREMVNISSKIYGWEQYIYNMGCRFIHLSAVHNYKTEEIFNLISKNEKVYIKKYLNQYHEFSIEQELNISTVTPYLYKVFSKVKSNLLYLVDNLEKNKSF